MITASDPGEPVAHQRLALLELADRLGNVSEACRRMGFSRTQYYVYRQRYQDNGFEGLKDLPPIPKSHPNTTAPELADLTVALSLAHPSWGCDRLSAFLRERNEMISSQTVQNILNRNELGTKRDRWLALERQRREGQVALTERQLKFLQKQNPAFRDRHLRGRHPGDLVNQYAIPVGRFIDAGLVYAHAAIDTYSNYAFACLHSSKRPEAAVALLESRVIPFFRGLDLDTEAILTNNGREFCGGQEHPYEQFLSRHGIEHLRAEPKRKHTSGFLQRFHAILLSEFFGQVLETRFYRDVDDLQKDLDDWLVYYNTRRPHLGYPNMGWSPLGRISAYRNGSEVGQRLREQDL